MLDHAAHTDALHKERSYRGLARHYGTEVTDAWLSLHAQIAADLAAMAVLVDDENTARWIEAEVAASITPSAENAGLPLTGEAGDAAYALSVVRDLIQQRLPEHLQGDWRNRLAPADWLASLPAATPDRARDMVRDRLSGMTPEDFTAGRFSEADQYMQQANAALAAGGQDWDAVEALYASDLAAFEGWLIARSVAAGDTDFIQAEMRWALAVGALSALESLPPGFDDAASVVRSRLAWAVGPRDGLDLARHLSRPATPSLA